MSFDSPRSLNLVNLLVIGGEVLPADIPALCRRARALLVSSDDGLVVCDMSAVSKPNAATVDAVARLQLTAGRAGRRIRFVHATRELTDLLTFIGLSDVVTCSESGVQSRREAEQREEVFGVEEETDPGDLPL